MSEEASITPSTLRPTATPFSMTTRPRGDLANPTICTTFPLPRPPGSQVQDSPSKLRATAPSFVPRNIRLDEYLPAQPAVLVSSPTPSQPNHADRASSEPGSSGELRIAQPIPMKGWSLREEVRTWIDQVPSPLSCGSLDHNTAADGASDIRFNPSAATGSPSRIQPPQQHQQPSEVDGAKPAQQDQAVRHDVVIANIDPQLDLKNVESKVVEASAPGHVLRFASSPDSQGGDALKVTFATPGEANYARRALIGETFGGRSIVVVYYNPHPESC